MKIFYDKDSNPQALAGKKIVVIGYGSQGHAHANNLKDAGHDVIIGLHPGSKSCYKAKNAGLEVKSNAEAAAWADIVMMLVPDEVAHRVYQQDIAPGMKPGKYLAFAHGFSIHFGKTVPPKDVNVFMVAPKSPGHLLRSEYTEGRGVPSLLAIHQDATGDTREVGLAYACAIGSGRAGVLQTTFKEETETDLFGEQAVLCGGLTALIQAGFETLVEAGYSPEMAYFECLHEMKLIVDLVYEGGLGNMRYSVSNTAEYGDLTRGPKVINQCAREEMKKLLADIQSGRFAEEWMAECEAGKPRFKQLENKGLEHPIEVVGARLRGMMPWLKQRALVDRTKN